MYDISIIYILRIYYYQSISSYDFMISHNILHGYKTLDTYFSTWIPHKTWSTPHRGAKAGAQNFRQESIQTCEPRSEKPGCFNRDPDFMVYEIILMLTWVVS